jgi:hypothetical protein
MARAKPSQPSTGDLPPPPYQSPQRIQPAAHSAVDKNTTERQQQAASKSPSPPAYCRVGGPDEGPDTQTTIAKLRRRIDQEVLSQERLQAAFEEQATELEQTKAELARTLDKTRQTDTELTRTREEMLSIAQRSCPVTAQDGHPAEIREGLSELLGLAQEERAGVGTSRWTPLDRGEPNESSYPACLELGQENNTVGSEIG